MTRHGFAKTKGDNVAIKGFKDIILTDEKIVVLWHNGKKVTVFSDGTTIIDE